jgi:dihydrofolate reductase
VSEPVVKLVAAVARNRVIGRDNALPWHLPTDLKRFRRLTLDKAVIMGRKTFDSIGIALPRRRNIVITRREDFDHPDVTRVRSLGAALSLVEGGADAMVIGGGEIYAQALPLARVMHLTLVDAEVDGDALFPEFDPGQWTEYSARSMRGIAGRASPSWTTSAAVEGRPPRFISRPVQRGLAAPASRGR